MGGTLISRIDEMQLTRFLPAKLGSVREAGGDSDRCGAVMGQASGGTIRVGLADFNPSPKGPPMTKPR